MTKRFNFIYFHSNWINFSTIINNFLNLLIDGILNILQFKILLY